MKSIPSFLKLGRSLLSLCGLATVFLAANNTLAGSPNIVIAEVYGGGGNSSAPYKNDFVVLFNRGTTSQSINGWSIQYTSAAGSSWSANKYNLPNVSIDPGKYYLIRMTLTGSTGADLPTPDVSVSSAIDMSATAGKVALVNSTTALTGTNPPSSSFVDLVGYGTTANGFEGAAAAPAPSNTKSVQRLNSGCTDTDNNSTDFAAAAPNPRNGATAANICPQPASQVLVETDPNGNGAVLLATNLTAGNSVTVYAIARDVFGRLVANTNATWSLSTKTAGVVDGDLVPAGDNKSATFTGHWLGTAAISATVSGLAATNSGTITVRAGGATQVRVETLADGSGILVPATNVAPGHAIVVYAIQRDTYGNFVTNIAADAWSLPTKTGGVVDGDLVAAGNMKSATFTGAVPGTATIRATSGVLPNTDSGLVTVPASPTPPSGTGVADPVNVVVGQSTTLRVTVAPGATPVSSGLAVTADLTAMGGAASQSFTDAGGNIFTNLATVAVGALVGTNSLPVTITDAENRTNTTAISLVVGVAPGVTAPASLTTNATGTAVFSVTGSGTGPLSYQWCKGVAPLSDGGKISGSTTATLTLTSVLAADAGSYSVLVTNLFGSVTSSVATLTVLDPVIVANPGSRTNNSGTTATFSVGAVGTAPLGYQWLLGGAILADGGSVTGAVTTTLTITNVSPANAGGYSVVVSNANSSVTSLVATLTVMDLAITKNPTTRTNSAGDNAYFYVTAVGTTPAYQWQLNGADIAGATASSLTRSNVGAADVGNYWVTVSNASGILTSAPAALVVVGSNSYKLAQWNFAGGTLAPSTGSGTASLVGANTTATFAQGTSSDPTGTAASGWNTATYPTQGTGNKSRGAQFAVSTLGYTNVVVAWEQQDSNTGSKYSGLQYTTNGTDFVDGPVITLPTGGTFFYETVDLSAVPGVANNASFAFRLMAEWESSAITNGNNNYVAVTSGSTYGPSGTMRYDMMSIFANPLPLTITTQPTGGTVECGNTAGFSVTASGATPLGYQWRVNGSPITGSNSAALSFNPATMANAANYDVVVSNPFAAVTSAVVALTVTDATPPSLSLPTDFATPQTSEQGAAVTFSATAYDLCAGSVSVTCVPASGSVFPIGATTVHCTAGDGSTNTASGSFQVTVQRQWVQVSGTVELEHFVGPAHDGAGNRTVTFIASDDATNKLKTVDLALDFTGGAAAFTLTNLPVAMTHLSAKTAWTLRTRLSATFTNGAAVVNFTGDNALLGGDFDNSNLVDIEDYFQLAAVWYRPDAAADIDGSGLVDVDDYFILASHWYLEGDPE